MISFTTFGRSFRHAIRGLGDIARAEQSFRLQLIVALLILVLTFFVDLDQWEKILLILLVAAVLVLEIVNTILERIADAVVAYAEASVITPSAPSTTMRCPGRALTSHLGRPAP